MEGILIMKIIIELHLHLFISKTLFETTKLGKENNKESILNEILSRKYYHSPYYYPQYIHNRKLFMY